MTAQMTSPDNLPSDAHPYPQRGQHIRFPAETAPRLAIVVHTEEEFDWDAPFARANNTVKHVPDLAITQEAAEAEGFYPHYSCGYPIASDPHAVTFFRPLFSSGRASLGAHLHPWVCPPYDEDVNNANSFPGNLTAPQERAKIASLTDALETAFGIRPTAYLAGRYGYGANTSQILSDLGYQVDFSIAPGWDYRSYDGPNWRDHSAHACFNAAAPGLLHVPHSGGHIGFLCNGGQRNIAVPDTGLGAKLKLPGIAARLGAVAQARLTIEGMPLDELKRLARALHADNVRLFTLSFHSPSASVGYTPYAKTPAARDEMVETMRAFLAFFRDELGGQSATPDQMFDLANAHAPAAQRAA